MNAVGSPKEQINEDSIYLDHADLLRFASNCSVSSLWNCPGTMLHRILHAPEVKEVDEASTDSAHSVTHGSHDMDYSKPVSEPYCERCKAFFNKYVKFSENAYQVRATRTVSQSHGEHSSLWHYCRKLRIQSSKLAAVPKTARADPQKFVKSHLYPRFKGTANIEK